MVLLDWVMLHWLTLIMTSVEDQTLFGIRHKIRSGLLGRCARTLNDFSFLEIIPLVFTWTSISSFIFSLQVKVSSFEIIDFGIDGFISAFIIEQEPCDIFTKLCWVQVILFVMFRTAHHCQQWSCQFIIPTQHDPFSFPWATSTCCIWHVSGCHGLVRKKRKKSSNPNTEVDIASVFVTQGIRVCQGNGFAAIMGMLINVDSPCYLGNQNQRGGGWCQDHARFVIIWVRCGAFLPLAYHHVQKDNSCQEYTTQNWH